jgi:hypothetical protein
MKMLREPHLSVFVVVSSDGDFTALYSELVSAGKIVFIFGEQKTPKETRCLFGTTFVLLEDTNEESEVIMQDAGNAGIDELKLKLAEILVCLLPDTNTKVWNATILATIKKKNPECLDLPKLCKKSWGDVFDDIEGFKHVSNQVSRKY